MNYRISTALAAAFFACAPAMAQEAGAGSSNATQVQASPAIPVAIERPINVVNGSVLASNSDVWVSLDRELTSKNVKVGDTIDFKVSRDVMLGQFVVIPRGTPAKGHVSYRSGKGAFGKSAKLEFDIDNVTLNGRTIPLGGHYRIEGQGNTGATVAALATVWIAAPFITGRSATAVQGSEWKAATKEPLSVTVAN